MFEAELLAASQSINQSFDTLGIPRPYSISWAATPFAGQWGFGTAACFQVAAAEARSGKPVKVPVRAQEIAEAVLDMIGIPEGFSRADAVRGYINIYIDPPTYAQKVIRTVLENGDAFGKGAPKGERVMVEYSQPNTHKAFHVGHLRNVILGGAMANILEHAGYETIRANYIGDIGWHVIKWMWCYLKYYDGQEPEGDRNEWIQQIYSRATSLVESDPELEAEARQIFARWDQGDPEIHELWKRTRKWSLDGFGPIYEALGEHFDVIFSESDFEDSGKELVDDLIARGIAIDERPDDAVIVRLDELLGLEKETYRTLVVLRSDGTSLYSTKDLPLAITKFEEWHVDRSIYVIDVRQAFYLQQIFKLLEVMGFEQAKKCHHLSYEIVNLPGNVTMSSRKGTVVMFNDLLKEAISRAADIIEEKNPALAPDQKRHIAHVVALGALKYPLLAVDSNKVATFDWDRALDFNGQAAPYIQYAHVRASSILSKAGTLPDQTTLRHALEPQEIALLDRISRFPEAVQRSAEDYKPLIIANYTYDLAREFTDFYLSCPVLKAEKPQREFRLRLTAAAKQTLANSLRLLGITALEVM